VSRIFTDNEGFDCHGVNIMLEFAKICVIRVIRVLKLHRAAMLGDSQIL
jgi:hypothetical protein